jgi:heme/copper-type cytochrome/quinol oxidase subunit 2
MNSLTTNGPVLAQMAELSRIAIAILALLAVVVIFALVVVAAVVMARSGKRSPNNLNPIHCPLCNHNVSPEATKCAGCGHPLTPSKFTT